MPKPITMEMLLAMSLDQRKTLHRNALNLDTPAARAVLELLSQDDMIGKPKAAPSAPTGKARRVTKKAAGTTAAAKPARTKTAEPRKVAHGRRA